VEGAMFAFLTRLLLVARSRLKSRASFEAENLVLRQQVIVLSRKPRSRVRLRNIDRLIFVWLFRFFPAILNVITVVKPETVIRWRAAEDAGRARISINPLENAHHRRLMVWTPARLYAASQWAQDVLKQHPKKARRVRDGSYNDRDRLGKECVRGVRCR
jgi:hypothetical protein